MRIYVLVILALTLGVVACSSGCGAAAAVRAEVRTLKGCDSHDVQVIVSAAADIVSAATLARTGGSASAAIVLIVERLGAIRDAWSHCRSTASQAQRQVASLAFSGLGVSDIDAVTDEELLGELLATVQDDAHVREGAPP